MKKQLSIDLAGRSFGIEEEAYDLLHNYIEEFQNRFAQEGRPDELMDRFEGEVSAFFSEKQRFGMNTIKEAEVRELMGRLGSAVDYVVPVEEPEEEEIPFAEEVEEEPVGDSGSQSRTERPRRLYRDVNNRMIGGIAAGLSNYLDIDVSIIRIVMLALCCFTFPVFVAYFIAWLVLKPEPSGIMWQEEPHRLHKKLYRNTHNKILGGVASGVSSYFGWEPTWMRLLLVLFFVPWLVLSPFYWFPFGWAATVIIPAYIVLWIILPTQSLANEDPAANADKAGAEEFSERVRQAQTKAQSKAQTKAQSSAQSKGLGESVTEGFNKGAGCAANGCGCLVFLLALPLFLGLFVAIGALFFGLPISTWIYYLHSPEDWFEMLPLWSQLLLSASGTSFVALSAVGIVYLLLRVLLDLPRLPILLRLLFWTFWALSLATFLFCVIAFILGIGMPASSHSIVL